MSLGVFSACSDDDTNGSGAMIDENEHTYNIEIAGGETFSGSVPKNTGGLYYPVSYIEYNEEVGSKILTGLLQDAGKFQFGIGLALDNNNNPSIQGSGPGLTFGEWGVEDKYRPVGNINMDLENYQEHSISLYGEEATVASYTLSFSGKFKLGAEGDEVNVTGKIGVAAP
ncbi:hypothetical protein DNG35_09685 [Mesonia sp. K7]|nr:hypothetical protein DNG35_09685 [Mesonia sp. K7]